MLGARNIVTRAERDAMLSTQIGDGTKLYCLSALIMAPAEAIVIFVGQRRLRVAVENLREVDHRYAADDVIRVVPVEEPLHGARWSDWDSYSSNTAVFARFQGREHSCEIRGTHTLNARASGVDYHRRTHESTSLALRYARRRRVRRSGGRAAATA